MENRRYNYSAAQMLIKISISFFPCCFLPVVGLKIKTKFNGLTSTKHVYAHYLKEPYQNVILVYFQQRKMERNGLKNGTNPNREVMIGLQTSAKHLKHCLLCFQSFDGLLTFLISCFLSANSVSSKNFTVLLNLV